MQSLYMKKTLIAITLALAGLSVQAEPINSMDDHTAQLLGGVDSSQQLVAFSNEMLDTTPEGQAVIKKFYQLLPYALLATQHDNRLRNLAPAEARTIAALLSQGRKDGVIAPEAGLRIANLLAEFARSPAANEILQQGLASVQDPLPVQTFLNRLNGRLSQLPNLAKIAGHESDNAAKFNPLSPCPKHD